MPIIADNGRGAHPKLRASSLRFWTFDESVLGQAFDLAQGDVLDSVTLNNVSDPLVVASPIGGFARRFNNSGGSGYPYDNWLYGAGDATSRTAHVGDMTIEFWIRLTATPASREYIYAYAGPATDVDGTENYLRTVRVEPDRRISVFWENGTGTNVGYTGAGSDPNAFSPVLQLYQWYHVAIRWSATTGEGPGGKVDVDMFINGLHADGAGVGNTYYDAMDNSSGGSAANYVVGAEYTVSNNPSNFLDGDLAGLYVYSEALTSEEIEDDFRRGLLLPFYHRLDARVLIEDPGGVMVDMTNHLGEDFLVSVDLSDSVDDPTMSLTATLNREVENLSVSVLRTDSAVNLTDQTDPTSYSPLLAVTRGIHLQTARVPLGIRAYDSDYITRLEGVIDEIDWGSDKVSVRARDNGGRLIDAYIEEEVRNSSLGGASLEDYPSYGTSGGTAVEGEMQKILDDNDNTQTGDSPSSPTLYLRSGSYDPVTLYTPTTPAWFVLPWRQRREPVLTALRALAAQIGWDLRYKYDPNPHNPRWRLTFFEPNRLEEVPSCLLRPGDILDVSRAGVLANDIRNVVRIVYLTSESPDTAPTNASTTFDVNYSETYKNKGADAQGNRRPAYYQIEDATSIATYGRRFMEMQEAAASQVDTIDEAQAFALAALRDLREPDFTHNITSVPLPEMSVGDIIRMDSNSQLYTGQQQMAITSLGLSLGERSASTFSLRGKPTVGFRRWLQLAAGPGAGPPPVIDPIDSLTDVNIGGLLNVINGIIDITDYLGGGKFVSVKNPEFASFTRGIGNPPDGWLITDGDWGTDALLETTTTQTSGKAIKIVSPDVGIRSDLIPAEGGGVYMSEITSLRNTAGDASMFVTIQFFAADRTTVVGQSTFQPASNVGADVFDTRRRAATAPATARWAKVFAVAPPTVTTYYIVDKLSMYRVSHECQVARDPRQAVALNAWTKWTWNDDSSQQTSGAGPHDYGGIANTSNSRFEIKEEGYYEFGCDLVIEDNLFSVNGVELGVRFLLNGTTVVCRQDGWGLQDLSAGAYLSCVSAMRGMVLQAGDYLEIEYYTKSGDYVAAATTAWCKLRYTD